MPNAGERACRPLPAVTLTVGLQSASPRCGLEWCCRLKSCFASGSVIELSLPLCTLGDTTCRLPNGPPSRAEQHCLPS